MCYAIVVMCPENKAPFILLTLSRMRLFINIEAELDHGQSSYAYRIPLVNEENAFIKNDWLLRVQEKIDEWTALWT